MVRSHWPVVEVVWGDSVATGAGGVNMTRSFLSWRSLMLGCAALLFMATPTLRAEEDDKGKGKGKKDEKPNVIQIDLSKLPPDLAKALQKYATDSKKPGPPAKAPMADKKPASTLKLPPGLAKKPADHPGRVAWLKAHGSPAPSKEKEKDKKKDKKKNKKDDDDDN